MADEPTGALDSTSAAAILDLFSSLHAEGVTIVMVTHDSVVARRAARTITMRDARIESDLATADAARSPL
jgi:putative ABC transport system ATP-binding protein